MRRIEIYERTRARAPAGADDYQRHAAPLTGETLARLAERLGGTVLQEGTSAVVEVVRVIKRDEIRGAADTEALGARCLEVLFPGLGLFGKTEPERFLFFDIETTGLSGGAGTRFFLIGLLSSTGKEMKLVQYFLPALRFEPFFLETIKKHFTPETLLVSYNGRSFDYNVMRNRFIMNGLQLETGKAPRHLDLLFPTRRLWKGLCADFRLSTVERVVLGYRRKDDIPGEMIPDVYFRHLDGRDRPGELETVLEHNRDDILSLHELLLRQAGVVREGTEGTRKVRAGYNPVSLADMLRRAGRTGEAVSVLLPYAEEADAALRLGLLCKRERSYEEAVRHFGTILHGSPAVSRYVFACTEIAKIYEHAVKDYQAALSYANRARERLARANTLYPGGGEREKEIHEVAHRIARLEKKIETKAGRSG